MREELTLNHVETNEKLSRTSSISSHLYRQLSTKSPSHQVLRVGSDEKTIDAIHTISEATNKIIADLHSLIERSKDNAFSLLDLKQNIANVKCDQKIIDEIRSIVTLQSQTNNEENKCQALEKLDKILQVLDINNSTYNVQTQLLTDISKKLEAIEVFQEKLLSQKMGIDHLVSSYETLQQTNIKEMECIYRRKIEMSAELAQLDTNISHRKDMLNQLKERVEMLENRLGEIQLKLNKQREENKKLNGSSVIKKKTHQTLKSSATSQNIRHFSLSDIHNRNPSVITLASSKGVNSTNNTDSTMIHEKEKRKISWSRKVANVMGLPFQHNNKENSVTFLQGNEKVAVQGKRRNYPSSFGIKSVKTFRSFSTRA